MTNQGGTDTAQEMKERDGAAPSHKELLMTIHSEFTGQPDIMLYFCFKLKWFVQGQINKI